MTDTEKDALERRIDELCAEVERLRKQLHDQQDTAEHNFVRNAREYKRVCDENERLRSLARGTCYMEYCLELSNDELYPTEAYECSACGGVTVEGKPDYCPRCGAKVVDA